MTPTKVKMKSDSNNDSLDPFKSNRSNHSDRIIQLEEELKSMETEFKLMKTEFNKKFDKLFNCLEALNLTKHIDTVITDVDTAITDDTVITDESKGNVSTGAYDPNQIIGNVNSSSRNATTNNKMKFLIYYNGEKPFVKSNFSYVKLMPIQLSSSLLSFDKEKFSQIYFTYFNEKLQVRNFTMSLCNYFNIDMDRVDDIFYLESLFENKISFKPIFVLDKMKVDLDIEADQHIYIRVQEDILDYIYANSMSKFKSKNKLYSITDYYIYFGGEIIDRNLLLSYKKIDSFSKYKHLAYVFPNNKRYIPDNYLKVDVNSYEDIINDLFYRNKFYIKFDYFIYDKNEISKHSFINGFNKSQDEKILSDKVYVFTYNSFRYDNYTDDYAEKTFCYVDVSSELDIVKHLFYNFGNLILDDFYILNNKEFKACNIYLPILDSLEVSYDDLGPLVLASSTSNSNVFQMILDIDRN